MTFSGSFDMVGLVGFIAAAVFSVMAVGNRGLSRLTGSLMAAAFLVLAFVMFSNTLEHLGITAAMDPVEDYVEVVFFPLFAYGSYVAGSERQMNLLRSTARAAQAEHDMMMGILDSANVAIVMTDTRGCAGFANRFAEDEFGVYGSAGHERQGSTVIVPAGVPVEGVDGVFDISLVGRYIRDERWDAVTAEGRMPLMLSASPMHARDGEVAGAVVVFVRATSVSPGPGPVPQASSAAARDANASAIVDA